MSSISRHVEGKLDGTNLHVFKCVSVHATNLNTGYFKRTLQIYTKK